jgi:PAS domain S-box-containing protein
MSDAGHEGETVQNSVAPGLMGLYRAFIEESLDGMLALDGQGRVIDCNRRAVRLSGYLRGELLGMTLTDLVDSFDHAEEHVDEGELRGRTAFTKECKLSRKVGSPLPVKIGIRGQQGKSQLVIIREVGRQGEIMKRLEDSERKYRELVEQANSIILRWTANGRITFLNEYGQKFFGYAADEILGRHVIGTIVPPTESKGRDMQLLIEQICADTKAFECNINENMRRGGERVWISWTNRIVTDVRGHMTEILSVGTDITERKLAEDAIARERSFADDIINTLPGIFYMYDDEGRLVRWNRKGEEQTGYSRDELTGRNILDFFPEAYKPIIVSSMKRLFSESESYTEAPLLLKDGREVPYYFSARKVTLDERKYSIGLGIDITERKKAEEEIRRLHEDLQSHAAELERRVEKRTAELEVARDRAEESDRLKSAFLATMSHELRTPLNSIIGFTGIMLMGLVGPLTEEQKKQLNMVQESAQHLLKLINEVLDISKIEAGQFDLARSPFDMRTAIRKSLEKIKPLADKKGLSVTATIAPAVGQMTGDLRRVEQVLLNLLGNAVKFTEEGAVSIESKVDGNRLVTRVTDTGIGIGRDDLETIFKPFRQVDTGIARQYEGTGLGLSICKRLAEAMGGTIHAESERGKGSCFTFTLPLEGVR